MDRISDGDEAVFSRDLVSYGSYGSSLRDLPRLRTTRRKRASIWDRSGGNDDRLTIQPGETTVLADIAGAGSISHIWVALDSQEPDVLRKLLLRMSWEGEAEASVLVPIGDFFGGGHRPRSTGSALHLA